MIDKIMFWIIGFICGCIVNLAFLVNERLDGEFLFRSDIHSTQAVCEAFLTRSEGCGLTWISKRYLQDH